MDKTWKLSKNNDTPLELYQNLVNIEKAKDARWKWFALGSFFCLLLSIGVMVYALNLPKTVPLVVTVSDWGEAKYVGNISTYSYEGLKIPQVAIEYQIRKFLSNKYSIPLDATIFKTNLTECYSALTQESANKLTEELKENDPRKLFGQISRTISVETILKLSDQSYQADFYVTTTGLDGTLKSKEHIRGVLTVKMLEPSEEEKKLNPLGIYFSNFDFTVVETLKSDY